MLHLTNEMMEALEKTISFTEGELPELKNWILGGKYTIELEIVQRSRHEFEDADTYSVFTIKNIKVV